jgi:hypothetical protein
MQRIVVFGFERTCCTSASNAEGFTRNSRTLDETQGLRNVESSRDYVVSLRERKKVPRLRKVF